MQNRHWSRKSVVQHPLFWFMVPALLGPPAFNTAFFFQQVHFTGVKGWSHLSFVALIPIYTLTAIAAMVGSGWLLDRFGTRRLIRYFQVPMIAAFATFAVVQSLYGAALGLFFLALTSGAQATLPNAFWAEFYGTRYLGAIKSMAAAIMVLGSAIGPGMTGVLIDARIGIETQYAWFAGYFVLATLLMFVGVRRFG